MPTSRTSPYLAIYCSEVAACTGHHKYKTRHEALEAVWRRADSEGYHAALHRCGSITEEERVQDLLTRQPQLARSLEEGKNAAQDASVEHVQHVTRLAEGQCTDLPPTDKAALQKHVRHSLFTQYGTHAEDDVVDLMNEHQDMRISRDNGLRKSEAGSVVIHGPNGPERHRWRLAGRADGFRAISGEALDTVVEVKNRVRELPPQLPLYELIQTQAYCQVFGLPRAQVVEALRQEDGTHLKVTDVHKDDVFWRAEIKPALNSFMAVLARVLGDPDMQDQFVRSKRRAALLAKWSPAEEDCCKV